MFRTILVGYDDSEQAKDGLAFGRLVAATTGAELVIAGILPQDPLTGSRDVLFAESDAELKQAVERAAEASDAMGITTPAPSAAHGLHGLAEELAADLIVVGSCHRSGIGRALAGTVAQRLLHGASCAVAMAPKGYREARQELREIAVAYDGSSESREALSGAVALAEPAHAELHLLTAVFPPALGDLRVYGYPSIDYIQALREHYAAEQQAALDSIPGRIQADAKLLGAEIAQVVPTLFCEVERGIDLLCIGSRSYGPVRRVLLGSVSSKLVKDAPCPLLLFPRAVRGEPVGRGEAVTAVTAEE